MNNNSLISLHGLCGRQDENFITESFVHLLRVLIEREPTAAVSLLKYITNGKLQCDSSTVGLVEIKTQVAVDVGCPDIEISDANHLFFVEVKVESDFGETQIRRYSSHLRRIVNKKTALITITKYPVKKDVYDEGVDYSMRWHNIHSKIVEIESNNEVVSNVISQFINLMQYRRLFVESVSWEMTSGVKSFKNLMDMIGESLSNTNYNCKKAVAWDWFGFYVDGSKYWVGTVFDNPSIILFHTEPQEWLDNLDVEYGIISNSRWENRLDLSSESEYFFARSKGSQIALIDRFVKDSIKYVEKLNVRMKDS